MKVYKFWNMIFQIHRLVFFYEKLKVQANLFNNNEIEHLQKVLKKKFLQSEIFMTKKFLQKLEIC